jgi:BirA family biotin operon repressor/biotin-[acetyl-CoA-carboxylase] ligase
VLGGTLGPETVAPLLRGRFGSPYVYAVSCESTQRLLDHTAAEGAVAVCEEQTSGRGRLGRRWEAPAGTAILCSILLRPPAERPAAQLSLIGGVAAARTVEAALGRPCSVKWPNDVVVDAGKIAGVLAEARDSAVVLGIGVNVNQTTADLPTRASLPAVSLLVADGVERARAPVLADLLFELEHAYGSWVEFGLEPMLAELAARDFLRGRRVRVGGVTGFAAGITGAGFLTVQADGGPRDVFSGEVELIQGRICPRPSLPPP